MFTTLPRVVCILITVAIVVFCLYFNSYQGVHKDAVEALFGVAMALGAASLVAIFVYDRIDHPRRAAAFKIFATHEGYKFSHWCDNTALAIDPDKKCVLFQSKSLSGRRVQKEYPFDAIRTWEFTWQTGGQLSGAAYGGGSLSSAMSASLANAAVGGQNRKVQKENALASGIFFDVKDTEYPRWHVAFKSQPEMLKMVEIVRQCLEAG